MKIVITADPDRRTVESQEQNEPVFYLNEDHTLTSKAFPSLAIPVHAIFAELNGLD